MWRHYMVAWQTNRRLKLAPLWPRGHLMRNRKRNTLVTTGKIEGKRSKSWQLIKILDTLAAWLGKNSTEWWSGEMEGHDCLGQKQAQHLMMNKHTNKPQIRVSKWSLHIVHFSVIAATRWHHCHSETWSEGDRTFEDIVLYQWLAVRSLLQLVAQKVSSLKVLQANNYTTSSRITTNKPACK